LPIKERSMSISVNSVARTSPVGSATAFSAGGGALREASAVPAVQLDQTTHEPLPPRFPWLSRLASKLEPVAKQKPAFSSAPPLGKLIDQDA
jgi:hypothetical protein